jgi:hypothetical protein
VGSEHLVSLLDSHSGVTCLGELFAPAWGAGEPRATTRVPRFFETDHDDPWAYWVEVTAGIAGQQLIGIKLPWSSLESHPRASELVKPAEVDVIRLQRANRVAQYVSVVLAMDSGVWQSTDGSYRERRVRIDPKGCIDGLQNIARWEKELDRVAADHRVFQLSYEQLALGERLEELQGFLGVEPQRLTSPYQRLRATPLRDVVENYDELTAALTDTPFAADLQWDTPASTRG